MASRKEQKEAARLARLEAEEAAQRARRRSARGKQLMMVIVGAVVVVVGLVLVSQSVDGGKADKVRLSPRVRAIDEVSRTQGQNGFTLGSANAPVTVTEYGDLQCPICKQASEELIPKLVENEVAAGRVKLVFKNWTILGDDSIVAARAAYAASRQDKYWQYVENFYDNQGQEGTGYVTDAFVESIAKAIGLDVKRFNADRASGDFDAELKDTFVEANRRGFSGTPSFTVSAGGKTRAIKQLPDYETLKAAIDRAAPGS